MVESDEGGIDELTRALGEAMGKFNPDRTVLPIKEKAFSGVAGLTIDESVGDWSIVAPVKAPEGAPNVLIVLIDDAGFGGPDTFGGDIRTPNLTRVQQQGVTYNRFHVTAVCSPTRAALLTGRNHHRVGMGGIAEFPGPFPGYTGIPSALLHRSAAHPQGERLLDGRVRQVAHDPGARDGRRGIVRPLADRVGLRPLVGVPHRRRRPVRPDHHPGQLDARCAGGGGRRSSTTSRTTSPNKTVEWWHAVRAQDQDKPWFVYYSTGATHAPHHVAKEWANKYKGQFDDGWDAYREKTLERQKRLGIVPEDTEAAARPDPYPAWEGLSDAEKKLYARQMEVFAGFSENADWNVGRLLDEIERMGELYDTLVIYIWGDNGASMEGTLTGSFNETTFFNGLVLDAEEQLALIDKYGGIEDQPRRLPHSTALRGRLGARQQHAVPVGQADG